MATQRRRRADQIGNPVIPKMPQVAPPDWPPGLHEILRAIVLALDRRDDVVFGLQLNGVDQPLRAVLNVVSGATLTDDPTFDRLNLTVP